MPADLVVLGHSLGELSAIVLAGILDDRDGLELVIRRAELCHHEHLRRPGRMVSLVGCSPATAEWVRRRAVDATDGVLEVAAWNSSRQVVLSGDVAAVEQALRLAGGAEIIGVPLDIGGGFHSSLMSRAADRLAGHLTSLSWHQPRCRVYSTSRGSFVRTGHEARELVPRALVIPVMWSQSLVALADEGIGEIIEVGPGTTLTKLSKRSNGARVRALGPPARSGWDSRDEHGVPT
jgi:[acyl-carrier-protein] S-malonyltransferase